MRTMLHAPRSRRRSIAAATLGALALVGSLLVATSAQALNDTGTGGVFTPATGRILDTAKGTGGFSTPMEAGKYRTIQVTGLAGVPDDGSVGAVSLNATVGTAPGYGTLFGRPDADTSRTSMLIYNGNTGEYVSNTATVAVGADGTIQIMAETSARVILDVQGYYTANTDGTAAGGFVPVAGKRFVDTRSGLGAPKATIAPGKSVDVQVTGANGVPAGASGAVVNLIAINSTSSDGNLTPYATGSTKPQNSLHYTPSATTSIQAQVGLSADGKMTIANASSTVNLVIDLQGYFTAAGKTGAVFTPGTGRAYDSRATGNTALAKNETRSIQIAGTAGVPVMGSGITAVVLTLIVAHGGSDGRAAVWADGAAKPDTTSINFQADEIRTNTVTVPLGANGKISLNNVADATNYVIDVQGWYANGTTAKVSCPTPYANGAVAAAKPAGPIGCSISLPAATATGQYASTSTDWATATDTDLSESASSTRAVQISTQGGAHQIYVQIKNADGSVVSSTQYGFSDGGDWRGEAITPTINTDTTAYKNATLGVNPSDDAFPEGVTRTYSVWATGDPSATPLWTSDAQDGAMSIPDGVLTAGNSYSWNAVVSGPSSGTSDTVKRTSPTWSFTASDTQIDSSCANELLSVAQAHGLTVDTGDWAQYCESAVADGDQHAGDNDSAYVDPSAHEEAPAADVAASGTQVMRAAKVYEVTYTATQPGPAYVWGTHMKGGIYYNGQTTWTDYHTCNAAPWGVGYDVSTSHCGIHKTQYLSTVHYQDILVSFIFKGFPVHASHPFHYTMTKKGKASYDIGYGF